MMWKLSSFLGLLHNTTVYVQFQVRCVLWDNYYAIVIFMYCLSGMQKKENIAIVTPKIPTQLIQQLINCFVLHD